MPSDAEHDLLLEHTVPANGGARVLDDPEIQSAQLPRILHSLTTRLGQATLKELVAEAVGAVERHCIEAALASTEGNRSAAAKMLGLSRQSLYMKLSRYDIGSD